MLAVGLATPKAWTLVVGLGLVSTLMPFWTWNAAQKYLKTSTLAMTAYFTPVIAMAMGIVFLGDGVTGLQRRPASQIVRDALPFDAANAQFQAESVLP